MSTYCVVNKSTYLCLSFHSNHGGNDSRHNKNGNFTKQSSKEKRGLLHSKIET